MEDILTFCLTVLHVIVLTASQRIAPGVPPQQYQQYQQPQYQQPQMQAHQVPVQQTPPYQQQGQPQVHSGQPQGHPHAHGQPQQLLNTVNIALEKEHIQEHLDVPIDTSKMTEQELQFHYFKMHDADNNNKLDGCELIKSLIHWHENEGEKSEAKVQKDSDLEAMIDPILKEMDTNNDGFVDYAEFKKAS